MKHPAETDTTRDLVRGRATLGDLDLTILTDGTYLLDGGAMFGVVPKPLWEKRTPANERNQILLGTNTVVVRTDNHTVVIETGIGNKLTEKQRGIFDARQLLLQSFAAAQIKPEQVDIVINTHLHFDHCGWNTTRREDGSIVPTFPNARYFAHRGEVEHGHLQLERDAVSYISENYDPLIASGQMTLLDVPDGWRSDPRRRGRHQDHRTAIAAAIGRQAPGAFARAKIGAEGVDLEHPPQPRQLHIGERQGRRYDAGVYNNPVKRPEPVRGGIEQRDDIGFGGYIALHDQRLAAGVADKIRRFFGRFSVAQILLCCSDN